MTYQSAVSCTVWSVQRFVRSCLAGIGLCLAASSAFAQAKSQPPVPDDSQLTATIAALDTKLFAAYNECDLKTFGSLIASGVEFYHDKGGVTLGRDDLVASVKNNICGKVRRELNAGTLEVYPIKNFGAVELGSHRFCELSTGRCEGQARFVHLWQYHDGVWQVSRVISYDHHLAPQAQH